MSFDVHIERVLGHEGSYANDPADPGGETNFGISKRAYPDLDIATLSRDDAKDIYRRDYWDTPGIGALPDEVAGSVLDMAVNAGTDRAVALLQACTNAFNQSQIATDGRLGPLSLAAVNIIPADRLLKAYTARRALHYMTIAEQKPMLRKFLGGWLTRAFAWL